jgi:FkbM family methyltransferase
MGILKKIYYFLAVKFKDKTARFYKGWVIYHSRRLNIRLLLNLDSYIDYLIYRNKSFEPEVINALRFFLHKYKISAFIDVGSNIGQMSLFVAKNFPSVKVVSYEAVPENFFQQKASMLLNGISYDLHNEAVSDTSGVIRIYLPKEVKAKSDLSGKYNLGMPSIHLDGHRDPLNSVDVKAIELSSVLDKLQSGLLTAGCLKPIFLLKIDVEGAELLVLKGLHKFISKPVNLIIIIEMLFGKNKTLYLEATDLLVKAGFSMYDIHQNPVQDLDCIDFNVTDFVFIKESNP